jgi:hypothetical protein
MMDRSDFPMPSLEQFRDMPPDQFESFWRTYSMAFAVPFSDFEHAVALRHAGWNLSLANTPRPKYHLSAAYVWCWFWRDPKPPGICYDTSAAYRQMVRTTNPPLGIAGQFAW